MRSVLGQIRGYSRWCETPAADAAALVEAAVMGAAVVPPHVEEPAVKKPKPTGGAAGSLAVVVGVPGPLAAAAGPDERRQLKLAAPREAIDSEEPMVMTQLS